jgi:hypothetical protein
MAYRPERGWGFGTPTNISDRLGALNNELVELQRRIAILEAREAELVRKTQELPKSTVKRATESAAKAGEV